MAASLFAHEEQIVFCPIFDLCKAISQDHYHDTFLNDRENDMKNVSYYLVYQSVLGLELDICRTEYSLAFWGAKGPYGRPWKKNLTAARGRKRELRDPPLAWRASHNIWVYTQILAKPKRQGKGTFLADPPLQTSLFAPQEQIVEIRSQGDI